MLSLIFALVVGMIIGIIIVGMVARGKEYDAETAEYFYRELESRFKAEHDSVNRWRRIAVRQQTEIRVLHLIQTRYPEARDERSKLAALRFELEYVDDEFKKGFSPAARTRMIEVCKDLVWSADKKEMSTVIFTPSLPPRPGQTIRVGAHSC